MILKTKSLILRPLKRSDAKDVVEGAGNYNISKWLLVVKHPYEMNDAYDWIDKCIKKNKDKNPNGYSLGIELKSENKIIGSMGIHKIDRENGTGEIGYWINENYWRQGYGSEAIRAILDFSFNKLKLRRLEAGVFEGNPSSGKLLEKFGFTREGMRRESHICKADGKIRNEIVYGLLRKEYKE